MSIQPKENDAVLGGGKRASTGDVVLGGIEGVKSRMASAAVALKLTALSQALNYGEAGLDLVIQALNDESKQVQWTAYELLARRKEPKVQQALQSFPPISATGLNYKPLESLLVTRQWKEADLLTRDLVLKSVNREREWLRKEDIQKLSSEDLYVIDRLWTIYSNGRFGFSVQKKICESSAFAKYEITAEKFSDLLGWKIEKSNIPYSYRREAYTIKRRENIPFDLNAPEGHLPSICDFGGGKVVSNPYTNDDESVMGFYSIDYYLDEWSWDSFFGAEMIRCFLQRIPNCDEIPC
ncbi:GUN4 domain-containing protein [Argonema antarcticum]|uniref:GUN4 domain-containing protein n=1 Tax=Argonema antarcticum TaxID=2942763 RepID=UPI002011EC66|nr:GUN4 domain-containing protein [Argonema antarcticum]MCL1470981.1 GUN4 domain-containing protein [Argonema antarcticum A004/B2]